MYFFVRFTGIFIIIFGVSLMLAGIGAAIYGLLQNEAIVQAINLSLASARNNLRLLDARPFMAVLSLLTFVAGMVVAAVGQLLLVFADLAMNTRETNVILRSMKRLLE